MANFHLPVYRGAVIRGYREGLRNPKTGLHLEETGGFGAQDVETAQEATNATDAIPLPSQK